MWKVEDEFGSLVLAVPDKETAERWARLFEGSSVSFGRSYKQWNAWTGRFEEYEF